MIKLKNSVFKLAENAKGNIDYVNTEMILKCTLIK